MLQVGNPIPGTNASRTLREAQIIVVVILVITLASAPSAWAGSKFKTLYGFEEKDGEYPYATLILDSSGNLYGTTRAGGADPRYGTVFKLSPNGSAGWTESVLHSFNDADGSTPIGGVTFGAAGNLYGTTSSGGTYGYGTVFQLSPNGDGTWTENVLHSFDGNDGVPYAGLVLDGTGNLYGTTWGGGTYHYGTVFKLTENKDGTWAESVLHSFNNDGKDGFNPWAGLIFDSSGNLYGTTIAGGGTYGDGTVFELSPNGDGTWTENVLHSFNNDGKDGFFLYAGLIFDPSGNLYGTTNEGGTYDDGTVFELSPNGDGTWTENVLHSFKNNKRDGLSPFSGLAFDATGNLYGATPYGGANGFGTVFKLKPTAKGGWNEVVLHSFRNRPGAYPWSGLVFDGQSKLYGTTNGDSLTSFGSVFEIVP